MLLLQSEIAQTGELINKVSLLVLLPFLVAFSFIVFIIYRRNRESTLRRKQLELELQAIRAQIHPHFIFNCLNSIHYCIQQHQTEKASDYLLKFSFLTRRILENSGKKLITLEEDLDILKAYLELERLRSGDRFTYEIHLEENMETSNIAVPMLLLQPLVENAVWHGFESRKQDGKITIVIESKEDQLLMRVTDNGVIAERFERLQLPGKEKSLGRSLISQQLDALAELEGRETRFESRILTNSSHEHSGMITEITLPYIPQF
ncbi:MAG: histidine kinase [Flavobacteriales bacterium]|nr:histidine kinase [Flavobacteriales bacterium]